MSGTDLAYAATRRYTARHALLRSTVTAIVLRARYAMSGTDLAYAATRYPSTWPRQRFPHLVSPYGSATRCPTMSGTGIPYTTTRCLVLCAMSGTELGYAATRWSGVRGECSGRRPVCSALSACERATRCPVLT
eukprot:3940799-Rhodomonas_salina.3